MEGIEISFVVPTRNRKQWIAECAGSIMSQSYPNFELIIVDDNSDDGTYEFLKEWLGKEEKVTIHRNEARLGGGASRNVGAKLAKGEIIAICDDDDFYSCERAKRIHDYFADGKMGVMLNAPYARVDLVSKPIEYFGGEEFNHDEFKESGKVNYFCNPSAAMRKDEYFEVGGYPSETSEKTDDYQFLTNWIKAGKKVGFDPEEYVCFHRVLPDSMMVGHRGFDPNWAKKGD